MLFQSQSTRLESVVISGKGAWNCPPSKYEIDYNRQNRVSDQTVSLLLSELAWRIFAFLFFLQLLQLFHFLRSPVLQDVLFIGQQVALVFCVGFLHQFFVVPTPWFLCFDICTFHYQYRARGESLKSEFLSKLKSIAEITRQELY